MKFQSSINSLRPQIESGLKEIGLDLVELNCFQASDIQTLRITINDSIAPVGHKQCILASKIIKKIIPNIDDFNLEVFSPGIGRELKEPRDFEIFKGKLIEITLLEEKAKKQIGILKERIENTLSIIQDGEEVNFPLSSLKKVILALSKNEETITEISVEDI